MSNNDTEQTVCMQAVPQPEHVWLQKFTGDWDYETEAQMEPGKPPEKFSGTESVRSLGALWIVAEGRGNMPGGETAAMQLTLGFDPLKQQFVGTWIGSMMTHLWIYHGVLGADGATLTLDTEGPDMSVAGKTVAYRDVIQFQGSDQRTLTSHILTGDGIWQVMMTSSYRRK